jgi:hypothetical protein
LGLGNSVSETALRGAFNLEQGTFREQPIVQLGKQSVDLNPSFTVSPSALFTFCLHAEMSFGFGVGDFIEVGELAERLCKESYLVARYSS